MVEYTLTIDKNVLKVHINKQLHLAIKRNELIGIQSYVDGNTRLFVIEYTTRSGIIKCEYVERDQWTNLCKQVDEKVEWV